MPIEKRRAYEIDQIRKTNRACAVGNLMLAKTKSWQEFLKSETEVLENLPRKNLRSGCKDIQENVSNEIKKFCKKNFVKMEINILDRMYEDIKRYRGLSMPLLEFEQKYGKFKEKVLKGMPKHVTVVISLWGLQFKFPEDFLSKDICDGTQMLIEGLRELEPYQRVNFQNARNNQELIGTLTRRADFVMRATVLGCFNLLESFLNGLAWEFCQDQKKLSELSENKKKIIQDNSGTSLRKKIIDYPEIISGKKFEPKITTLISERVGQIKPYRDSLVHPSPFDAPKKFGGYDKLAKLYSMEPLLALEMASSTSAILGLIFVHVCDEDPIIPEWFSELKENCDEVIKFIDENPITSHK